MRPYFEKAGSFHNFLLLPAQCTNASTFVKISDAKAFMIMTQQDSLLKTTTTYKRNHRWSDWREADFLQYSINKQCSSFCSQWTWLAFCNCSSPKVMQIVCRSKSYKITLTDTRALPYMLERSATYPAPLLNTPARPSKRCMYHRRRDRECLQAVLPQMLCRYCSQQTFCWTPEKYLQPNAFLGSLFPGHAQPHLGTEAVVGGMPEQKLKQSVQ